MCTAFKICFVVLVAYISDFGLSLTVTTTTRFIGIGETSFSSVTVTVTPTDGVTGYWTRLNLSGNLETIDFESTKYLEMSLGEMMIPNFQSSDQGLYVFHATDGTETAYSPAIKVAITGIFEVTTTLTEEIVNIGQTFVLTCSYSTGHSVTEIKWMHIHTTGTSGFIDTTENKFSGSVPGNPSLTITNIDGNDLGDYWCYAVSSDGTGMSRHINLALPAGATVGPPATEADISTESTLSSTSTETSTSTSTETTTASPSTEATTTSPSTVTTTTSPCTETTTTSPSTETTTTSPSTETTTTSPSTEATTTSLSTETTTTSLSTETTTTSLSTETTTTSLSTETTTTSLSTETTAASPSTETTSSSPSTETSTHTTITEGRTIPTQAISSMETNIETSTNQFDGTTVNGTVDELCPCDCDYKDRVDYWASQNLTHYTMEELRIILKPELTELENRLRVNKANLSATIRRLTSAKDERPVAKHIGSIGIVFLIFIIGAIIVSDLTSIKHHINNVKLIWKIKPER